MNARDRKSIETLRLRLCDADSYKEIGGFELKVGCPEALLKKTYKKYRCEYCKAIDDVFPDLQTEPDGVQR